MAIRGVRGAIVVKADQPDEVIGTVKELLIALMEANPDMDLADLASAFFTATEDIVSAYPAQAARELGWTSVPMMCAREIPVPGGIPRCIRVLLHWNTELPQDAVHHVYLGSAAALRPDLVSREA